jgi:DNA-binding MarR family transcriptional regulator
MAKRGKRSKPRPTLQRDADGAFVVTPDADLTWLLHRAAQGMRGAAEKECERHGIQLRDYIVLSALRLEANLTQLELGKALALDKTTLTFQLDRLEKRGLVVRRADPTDRRSRFPDSTAAGRAVQSKVEVALSDAQRTLLSRFPSQEQRALRLMLCQLIEEVEAKELVKGSCL